MDIEQVKKDFDAGTIVCRDTFVKLVEEALRLRSMVTKMQNAGISNDARLAATAPSAPSDLHAAIAGLRYDMSDWGGVFAQAITAAQRDAEEKGHSGQYWINCRAALEKMRGDAFALVANAAPAQTAVAVPPEFKEALRHLQNLVAHDSYETEYDGRTMTICPSCGKQEGEHDATCEFVLAKAFIAAHPQEPA